MKGRLLFDGTDIDGWVVENDKQEKLGEIYYWNGWKCFVWEQQDGVIMSQDCLEEIVGFMSRLGEKPIKEL